MGSVVIVSGTPGSGKTTLCRALASAETPGLHLASDLFYEFIPNVIDPTTPEARDQNTVIMRALAGSVRIFAEGGYTVYLDGIIGPWFLSPYRAELEGRVDTRYVVLHAPAELARARVRERDGPGQSPAVLQMNEQLRELGALAHHGLEVADLSPDALQQEVASGLATGRFDLDWALIPD